jgi:hypothetical protein
MRYVTPLLPEEQEIARKVCTSFGQRVCGFDLLRADGRSYVIDVNGWSFVKGNDDYYEECAKALAKLFLSSAPRKRFFFSLTREPSVESQWRLKGYLSVFRHADRTLIDCIYQLLLIIRNAKAKTKILSMQSAVC